MQQRAADLKPDQKKKTRISGFDTLRGFSVISMVLFHFCYDLTELSGVSLAWFKPPFEDIWRASISWLFLVIAGCMCAYSRNNLKRGLQYSAVALAIFLVTYLAKVDTPISFGIIYCMGFSTLLYALLEKVGLTPKGPVAAVVLFACFLATLHLQTRTVGLGSFTISVPDALYSTEGLSWLGLPGPTFASGDYYPPLPYSLLYLVGTIVGANIKERGCPDWFRDLKIPVLDFFGNHALLIYIIHQPVLLVIASLAAGN